MRTAFLFILTFVTMLSLSINAHALDVDQVRFGVHPDKTRLVLDLSEVSDFRVFTLSDPYRMVIDLPSFGWKAGNISPSINAGVTGIRHGNLQPGISRIVFDMAGPIAVRSAFILPASADKPHRLVVDLNSVAADSFERARTNVHGTLNVQQTTNFAYRDAPPPIPQRKTEKPVVIIDPGHGGVDPGAVAGKIYEKNITLALAKTLKDDLEATGKYRVLMTRSTDIFIPLGERVRFARKHDADLFVSIHADSLNRKNVRGASVYTLSEKASDAQTAKLAARENKADLIAGIDLSVEDDEVANILFDLAMRDTMNQSNFFANALVESFQIKGVQTLERPHRSAGFAVLKAPDIPSVLVEAGFLSNRKEASLLNTSAHRKKIANALKRGIDAYFEQAKKNQRI